MSNKVIIPGGAANWIVREHRFADFVVRDKHTVYAWCKIYVDENPNATPPEFLVATTGRQEDRLTFLGAIGSNLPGLRPHPTETDKGDGDDRAPHRTANAVYRELAKGIRSGRIEVKKSVYLDDRPSEIDLTLCVIGGAPVFAIARKRKDHGQVIAWLLAAQDGQRDKPEAAAELLPPSDSAAAGTDGKTRGAWFGDLARFLARKNPQFLARLTDDEICRDYLSDHEARRNAGEAVPKLPHRRYIVSRIENRGRRWNKASGSGKTDST
jgi:hypothetical protein